MAVYKVNICDNCFSAVALPLSRMRLTTWSSQPAYVRKNSLEKPSLKNDSEVAIKQLLAMLLNIHF